MKNVSSKKIIRTTKRSRSKKISSISRSQNLFVQNYFRKTSLNLKFKKYNKDNQLSVQQQKKNNYIKMENLSTKSNFKVPNNNNILYINDLFPTSKKITNNYKIKSAKTTYNSHSLQQLTLKKNNIKNNIFKRQNGNSISSKISIKNRKIQNNKMKNEGGNHCTPFGNSIDAKIYKKIAPKKNFL